MRRERITITIKNDVLKKLDTLIDGQNIRNRSNAIERVLEERFKGNIIKRAIILGAFREVRFNGKIAPDVLVPYKGKSLIEHNFDKLKSMGVNEVIIASGNLEKNVRDILGDGAFYGLKIDYIKSNGTAGIFKKAKNIIKETFLMFNGDIFIKNIDIDDMYDFHKISKSVATLAVADAHDPSILGSITMKGATITDFIEKTTDTNKHLVNAGVYIMEPSIFNFSLSSKPTLEHDIFPKLAKKNMLGGYHINEWTHLHDEGHIKKLSKEPR